MQSISTQYGGAIQNVPENPEHQILAIKHPLSQAMGNMAITDCPGRVEHSHSLLPTGGTGRINIHDRKVKSQASAQRPLIALDADFFNRSQALVDQLLLTNYDGTRPSGNAPGRPHHGAQHQCRAVLWALLLLQIRRNMGEPEAIRFNNQWVQALAISCLLHDSGRKGDGPDKPEWKRASANHCFQAINAVPGMALLAHICADAIIFKDQPSQFPYQQDPDARLLRSLLHDADVLEVIRTRNDFQLDCLDIYQNFTHDKERAEVIRMVMDVRDIISAQHDLLKPVSLSEPDQKGRKKVSERLPQNYNEAFKLQFEQADNALMEQFRHLGRCKPELFKLLSRNALVPPSLVASQPDQPSMSLKHLVRENRPLGMCKGPEAGLSRDLITGKHWYVKGPLNEAAARNEKLMCDLARTLGLDVPECQLINEVGKCYFLSKWRNGLSPASGYSDKDSRARGDEPKKLTGEQKAQLMIVMSLLGNLDGIGAGWTNTMIDDHGQPVAIDWGEAGLFSSIGGAAQRKPRGVFGSTPYELEVFGKPKNPMVVHFLANFHPKWRSSAMENAHKLFEDVSEADLHKVARDLLVMPGDRLSQLIEQSGIGKVFERNLLQQIIAERIAWLAIRYPEACENQRLTPAEWRAIQTSGVRGYCRQIPAREVEKGQARFYQLTTPDGQQETMVSMRLTPEAALRLAVSFGGCTGAQHLREELNFYRNTVGRLDMTDEVRCDLTRLKHQWLNLKAVIHTGQWRFTDNSHHSKTLSDAVPEAMVERQLTEVIGMLDQFIQQKNGSTLKLQLLPELAFEARCLPGRVAPVAIECAQIDGTELSNGVGQRTGKQYPVVQGEMGNNAHYYERIMDNGVRARFHPGHLPNAKSIERTLTLTQIGNDLETGNALLQTLEQLGLDIHRPSWDEHQSQYLDQLAVSYGCDATMANEVAMANREGASLSECNLLKIQFLTKHSHLESTTNPRWDHHCRMLNGQLVFYRPPFPWSGNKRHETGYSLYHELAYHQQGHQRDIAALLDRIIHSGASLDCFNERARKGIQPDGNAILQENIQQGAGSMVFTRLRRKGSRDIGPRIILGSETLARVDALVLSNNGLRHESGAFPYTAPYARKLFQHQAGNPKVCWDLANKPYNIVNLTGGLSLLDEVEHIQVMKSSERARVVATLGQHFAHWWPNGRSLDDLVSCSYQKMSTEGPQAALVKVLGPTQFDRLVRLNPELDKGKLRDLRGFKVERLKFSGWTFNTYLLTYMNNCHFVKCDFSGLDIRQIHFKNCRFEHCWFANAKLDFDHIKTSSFTYAQDDDHWPMEKSLEALYVAARRKITSSTSSMENGEYLPIFKNYEQLGLHRLPFSKRSDFKFLIKNLIGISGFPHYHFSDSTIMQMCEYICKMSYHFPDRLLKSIDSGSIRQFLKFNGAELICQHGNNIKFDGFSLDFKGQYFPDVDLTCCSLAGAFIKNCKFSRRQLLENNFAGVRFINCEPRWLKDVPVLEKLTKALFGHQRFEPFLNERISGILNPGGTLRDFHAFIQSPQSIPAFDKKSTEYASDLASHITRGLDMRKKIAKHGWSILYNPVDFMSDLGNYVILDENTKPRITVVVCNMYDTNVLSECASHWLNTILPYSQTVPLGIDKEANKKIKKIMDKKTYRGFFSNLTMDYNLYFPMRRQSPGWSGVEGIDSLPRRFNKWYSETESKSPRKLKKFTEGEFKNTYIGIRINQFYDMTYTSNDKIKILYRLCQEWNLGQSYDTPYLEWRKQIAQLEQ